MRQTKFDHPFKVVQIEGRPIEVDVDIVPLIRWMMEIPGIKTLYSCQGDNEGIMPYVSLLSNRERSLYCILEKLAEYEWRKNGNKPETPEERFISCEASFYLGRKVRYDLRFKDNNTLKDFIELI